MSITASESKSDKVYVGKGWENRGGISISVKVEEIAKLTPNQYGEVRLFVGIRKTPDEKAKSTHWVAVDSERKSGYVPPRPPEGMPSDPLGHTEDKDLPF